MGVITDYDIMQILGTDFDYVFLPAIHTRDGILVTWLTATWSVSNTSLQCFSVSSSM
jgi:hypothetical protein